MAEWSVSSLKLDKDYSICYDELSTLKTEYRNRAE